MSEYTTVYLRNKNALLLGYREHPSFEETRNLSKNEIMAAIYEVDEYNKNVRKSFGCELFHLSTTPSRQLDVLQWSSSPQILTAELLDEVLEFYNEEIEFNKKSIAKNKETIAKLEARIVKANVDLYEKISEEIDDCNESIDYLEEELENKRYLYNKFYFLADFLV